MSVAKIPGVIRERVAETKPPLEKLEASLRALGMPPVDFRNLATVNRSAAERKAWRLANPERSAQYDELTARIEATLAERDAAEAQARHMTALRRMLAQTGVAERDVDAARSGANTDALAAAAAWWGLKSRPTWLVLVGNPGTGKTVAAVWLLVQSMTAGLRGQYRRAAEVVRMSAFDEGRAELERLKHAALLVLDDVGRETTSEYSRALLFDLLDTRHAERLPTVLASNLVDGALSRHLGDALTDRIRGDGRIVALKGKSLRGSK